MGGRRKDIPGNAADKGKVTGVGKGHFLVVELLQPIHFLGFGGPRVRLLQTGVGRVKLEVLVVHAGGGGVEVTFGACKVGGWVGGWVGWVEVGGWVGRTVAAGGLEDIGGDHGVIPHQHGLVGLDEAHAV